MAHFSESLCEEVIRSEGGCGLTRNEIVQMARFALRAIKNENPYIVNAMRYGWLREQAFSQYPGLFIALRDANGITAWAGGPADMLIDNAMQSAPASNGASTK